MSFIIVFRTCLVCGEDVAALPGSEIAMCATHSDADKRKALDRLEAAISEQRERLDKGN